MNNVVELSIPPKSDVRRYKRIQYTLSYKPDIKRWTWEFSFIERTSLCGSTSTMEEADQQARTHIDLVHGVHEQ